MMLKYILTSLTEVGAKTVKSGNNLKELLEDAKGMSIKYNQIFYVLIQTQNGLRVVETFYNGKEISK